MSCLTPNLGIIIETKPSKVTKDNKKNYKMRKSCNSVLSTGALSMKMQLNEYVLHTTAHHDLQRIRGAWYG